MRCGAAHYDTCRKENNAPPEAYAPVGPRAAAAAIVIDGPLVRHGACDLWRSGVVRAA